VFLARTQEVPSIQTPDNEWELLEQEIG